MKILYYCTIATILTEEQCGRSSKRKGKWRFGISGVVHFQICYGVRQPPEKIVSNILKTTSLKSIYNGIGLKT